jgi:hypothetical protein
MIINIKHLKLYCIYCRVVKPIVELVQFQYSRKITLTLEILISRLAILLMTVLNLWLEETMRSKYSMTHKKRSMLPLTNSQSQKVANSAHSNKKRKITKTHLKIVLMVIRESNRWVREEDTDVYKNQTHYCKWRTSQIQNSDQHHTKQSIKSNKVINHQLLTLKLIFLVNQTVCHLGKWKKDFINNAHKYYCLIRRIVAIIKTLNKVIVIAIGNKANYWSKLTDIKTTTEINKEMSVQKSLQLGNTWMLTLYILETKTIKTFNTHRM